MDYAIEIRSKLVYSMLAIGAVLTLFGLIFNSSWATLGGVLGFMLFVAGVVMFTSLSVVQGVPWLAQLISHHAEPDWDGELIHAEGSGLKVCYTFDEKGSPWFVAKDVCIAVGMKPPKRDVLKCGGIPILMYGDHDCFSEINVQAYLTSLAIKNHAANRMLVNIRNNVIRKLEKQRDDKKRFG